MLKVLKSHPGYLNAIKSPGSTWKHDSGTLQVFESYVCRLYGRKLEESE